MLFLRLNADLDFTMKVERGKNHYQCETVVESTGYIQTFFTPIAHKELILFFRSNSAKLNYVMLISGLRLIINLLCSPVHYVAVVGKGEHIRLCPVLACTFQCLYVWLLKSSAINQVL